MQKHYALPLEGFMWEQVVVPIATTSCQIVPCLQNWICGLESLNSPETHIHSNALNFWTTFMEKLAAYKSDCIMKLQDFV